MKPFVEKVSHAVLDDPPFLAGPLAFLKDWISPINDSNLELLTEPGAADAHKFGQTLALLYPHLLPKSNPKSSASNSPFQVWAASAERDVDTAKAWIKGALPHHDDGDGTGDQHVQLIRVPKHTPDWKKSLTPHVSHLPRPIPDK